MPRRLTSPVSGSLSAAWFRLLIFKSSNWTPATRALRMAAASAYQAFSVCNSRLAPSSGTCCALLANCRSGRVTQVDTAKISNSPNRLTGSSFNNVSCIRLRNGCSASSRGCWVTTAQCAPLTSAYPANIGMPR
ncbi:hypothetical protein D3C77_558370 [compost metagenome]